MSQSFYNNLAQLLEKYFSSHPICEGDKFRFIIENDEDRSMFKKALRTLTNSDITIKGIFSISEMEMPYDTFYVQFPSNNPRLIIGNIDTASINYLDTMRNAVSNNMPFADDALLYILKNDISSSIKSASRRLDEPGMPFDIKEISDALVGVINQTIQNNKEKAYLLDYISMKTSEIESKRLTMFDLGNIIDIAYDRSFNTDSFNLGYFRDERINQGQYSPSNDELKERIKNNRDLYEDVERIMKEGDKERGLEKLFDEHMTALIISHEEDWFSYFDYDTINTGRLTQREKKNRFVGCQVMIPSHDEDYNINPRDKKTNKKQQIIVFDPRPDFTQTDVKLTFERPLPAGKYPDNSNKSRENLTISIDHFCKFTIDPNNTNYKFSIIRLPIPKSDFTELAPYFSINNNGDILIDLPSNVSSVRLGTGTNELTIPDNGIVEWSLGCYLDISTVQDEINEFNIKFGDKDDTIGKFIVQGGSLATVPREPLYLIQDVYNYRDSYRSVNDNGDGSFSLLRSQEHQYSIKSVWFRQLLKGEQFLCCNHATTSEVLINVEQEFSYQAIDIQIPESVRVAYDNLCDYFVGNHLVPSLAFVSDELRLLYESYINAINNELSKISDNGNLETQYKNISKLGVVEDRLNNRVFLSPLHPMLVAYQLDFSRSYNVSDCPANVMTLASPLFLMPYISYDNVDYRPYIDSLNDGIRTWLFYERRNRQQQIRIDNLTAKVVFDKIIQFTANCSHLFADIDTPLKINAIGIDDDENIVIAIIRYIKECLNKNCPVQKIEVHLYVDNLLKENFYQKLYRLNHYDLIINEINKLKENLDDSYNYTEKDIIRVLLSRVLFYTHSMDKNDENNTKIYYSHLTFYRMRDVRFSESLYEAYMKNLPSDIGYNGLISQYSTLRDNDTYTMGFGIKGIEDKIESFDKGYIFRTSYLMNELYFNEKSSAFRPYHKFGCLSNKYVFSSGQLLQNIYDNSCWVTFITPEVDIDFFYRSNLFIIHFTDQLTLNSKYDSITVTNRIEQYNNLLRNTCVGFADGVLSPNEIDMFQQTMLKYFNVLNGRWLLELNRKTSLQVREKVSVVAACLVIREFLQKIPNTLWIPISIEEIVRVTKNIGLKEDHLFSKKELGIKGPMSDDLLIMGLDHEDPNNLKLYFYPVEVKATDGDANAIAAHGKIQITKTYQAFKQNILGKDDFVKCVYRSFFTSLMLLTAEKMKAYNLIDNNEYNKLQEHRIKLLNLEYAVQDRMPLVKFGHCGLMVFHQGLPKIQTYADEDFKLAVCNISIPFEYGLKIISGDNSQVAQTVEMQPHDVDDTAKDYMTRTDNEDEVDAPAPEPDPVPAPDPDPVPDPTPEPDPVPAPDPDPVPDPTPEPDPVPALDPVPDPTPEPDPAPAPASAPISAPSPADQGRYEMKILIGTALSNNKKDIYFEPNDPQKNLNLNMGITGTSGSGKTQNLSAIIYQLSKIQSENVGNHPIGMLIFDYKGDYNSDDFSNNVGGTCTFGNFPFNPLHLIYSERDKLVKNIPAITAERVSDALAKSYDSGPVQQARIKQVIIETYEEFGITRDPQTWSKTPPTLNDVINNYFDKYETTDTVYALFSNLKDWRIFESDPQKCVSIFNWLTCPRVIDLTAFSDVIKRAIVSLVLEIFNNEMHLLGPSVFAEDKREIRAFVIVDEAHQFLSKEYDALDKILREGRSFGVGMILATQNISDFKTKKNDYSTNIASWILHHQVNITKPELYSVFGNADPNLAQYSAFISKPGFNAITKFGKNINANSCVQYRNLINNG